MVFLWNFPLNHHFAMEFRYSKAVAVIKSHSASEESCNKHCRSPSCKSDDTSGEKSASACNNTLGANWKIIINMLYLVLPGFTWFYLVLPGFTWFYLVLPHQNGNFPIFSHFAVAVNFSSLGKVWWNSPWDRYYKYIQIYSYVISHTVPFSSFPKVNHNLHFSHPKRFVRRIPTLQAPPNSEPTNAHRSRGVPGHDPVVVGTTWSIWWSVHLWSMYIWLDICMVI